MKQSLLLLLAFFASYLSFAQPINIDATSATESRCESNGTITVQASGGSNPGNYRYQIVAPTVRDLQNSNVFTDLPPGSYTVVVKDIVAGGVTDTAVQSVIGTYQIMNPTATLTNGVCFSEGAALTINIANGRAPYRYEITLPTPRPMQTTNVFNNLTYGVTYTYRVWDSCNNFQTRTVTPTSIDGGNYTVAKGCLTAGATCGTYQISYTITPETGNTHRYPYTLSFRNPDGTTQTQTINSGAATGPLTSTFTFTGIAAEYFGLSVNNNCNIQDISQNLTSLGLYLNMSATASIQCDDSYAYKFDTYDNSNTALCDQPHGASVKYVLINPLGQAIDSAINNSFFSGHPGGSGYKIVRVTSCGSDTLTFNWAANPPLISVTATQTNNVCKVGVSNVSFNVTAAKGAARIIIISGPGTASFADGTTHNYTYPDTITNYVNNQAVNYFAPGMYTFRALDACGFITPVEAIVISSPRTASANFVGSEGCVSSNGIQWSIASNNTVNSGRIVINPGNYTQIANGPNASGVYSSLNDGTYYASYELRNGTTPLRYRKNMNTIGCDVIRDTVIIKPYVNPYFVGPSVTNCAGVQNEVLLVPDLNKGTPPFSYDITSGPVTRPQQSSPFFANLPLGTYTFRMSDACGNSYSQTKQIEVLTGVTFDQTGSTCENGVAKFGVPHSQYITYIWTRPNNTTFVGDSLIINPVTSADLGTYNVQMAVDVNGCKDTVEYAMTLDSFCAPIALPVTYLNFNAKAVGSSALLTWATAKEDNNKGFAIERSNNGVAYNQIAFVGSKSLTGTSNSKLDYNFTDSKPLNGANYYRLKQIDVNGKTNYSTVSKLSFGAVKETKIYPNPATHSVNVETETDSKVAVYNILGQRMTVAENNLGSLRVLNLKGLAPGNYFVHVTQHAEVTVHKLTIAK